MPRKNFNIIKHARKLKIDAFENQLKILEENHNKIMSDYINRLNSHRSLSEEEKAKIHSIIELEKVERRETNRAIQELITQLR